jgi:hypothetical protein
MVMEYGKKINDRGYIKRSIRKPLFAHKPP